MILLKGPFWTICPIFSSTKLLCPSFGYQNNCELLHKLYISHRGLNHHVKFIRLILVSGDNSLSIFMWRQWIIQRFLIFIIFYIIVIFYNCRMKQVIDADLVVLKKKDFFLFVIHCKTYWTMKMLFLLFTMRRKLMHPTNFTRCALVHVVLIYVCSMA